MTDAALDLDALEAAERKATPAPWQYSPWWVEEGEPAFRAPAGWIVGTTAGDYDAEFCARLRNAAPALIKAARKGHKTEAEWLEANGLVHVGLNAQLESTESDLSRARAEITRLREALEAAAEVLSMAGELAAYVATQAALNPPSPAP